MVLILVIELLNISRPKIELLIIFHNYSQAKASYGWVTAARKKKLSKNIYLPTYVLII